MATPKKKVIAVKPAKPAVKALPTGAAKPKKRWLVPVIMAAVLLGVGAQIYLRARYLESLKFDMVRVGRVVPQGADSGQSLSILAVATDKAGQVFIQEAVGTEPRLQRFDKQLSAESITYKPAKPAEKIVEPAAMDVAPDGNVYVLLKDSRVLVISNNLKFVRSFKTGLQTPSAIGVNSAGRVYVAASQDNKIVFYDNKGALEGEFGAPGSSTGDLVYPGRMRITADDEIVVIERPESGLRGKIFKADHSLRKTFLIDNLKNCEPVMLGVTADGKAYLNDHMGSRGIVAFDIATGKFFGESQTTKDGQKFTNPGGLGASRFSNLVFVHSVQGLMACMRPDKESSGEAE